MHDATDLQGTTQVNTFYSGGAIKASTTITDYAGIRIDTPSVSADGAAVTNNYGVYQSSSLQKNHFAGNVGIGTTSPFANASTNTGLNIDTGGHSSLLIGDGVNDGGMIQSSDNVQRVIIGANVYDSPTASWSRFTADSAALIDVYGEGSGAFISLNVDAGTSGFPTTRLYINNTGNVGIGTTAPAYKLDVSGGAIAIRGNAPGNSLRFDSIVSGTATSRNALYVDSSNVFKIGNTNYASNDIIGPTKTANLHVDGTLRVDALSGNAPSTDGYQEPSETIIGGSGSASGMLGDPGAWLDINVDGDNYYIPLYSAG